MLTRFVTPTVLQTTITNPENPDASVSPILELEGVTWRVMRVNIPWDKIKAMADKASPKGLPRP